MSYTRTVYAGLAAKFKRIGGKHDKLHFLENETDPCEVLAMTNNRATFEDVKSLGDFHIIFPEFLTIPDTTVMMLPGYAKISDVARCDSEVESVKIGMLSDNMISTIKKVFGVDDVSIELVTAVEVW